MIILRPRSEMDITTAFEAVIVGSNPTEGKKFCNFLFLSYTCFLSGHSLSVERVLAKHEGGVQFSLPASVKRSFLICPRKNRMSYRMSYRKWLKIVNFY